MLLTGKQPYSKCRNDAQVIYAISRAEPPAVIEDIQVLSNDWSSHTLWLLCERCLARGSTSRPDINCVVREILTMRPKESESKRVDIPSKRLGF